MKSAPEDRHTVLSQGAADQTLDLGIANELYSNCSWARGNSHILYGSVSPVTCGSTSQFGSLRTGLLVFPIRILGYL